MALPSTMTVAMQQPEDEGSRVLVAQMRTVPVPSLIEPVQKPPGTVIVRVLVTSICGSDLCGRCCATTAAGAWRGYTDPPGGDLSVPGGTGHEVMGEVADVVEPSSLSVGDRVLVFATGYVKAVPSARRAYIEATGMSPDIMLQQGGFCQYVESHETSTVLVPSFAPPGFDPLWYVVAQPVGTLIKAVNKLPSLWTKTVVILGQGQNGLLMTQLISKMGARRVISMDLFDNRLSASKLMGATHTVNTSQVDPVAAVKEITDEMMCDVAIDMVGHQGDSIDICSDMTAPDGTVLIFGLPPNSTDEDRHSHHSDMTIRYPNLAKNLSYITTHVGGNVNPMPMFEQAMEMLSTGRIDISPIMTHTFSYQNFPEAYHMSSNYEGGVIKSLITWQDDLKQEASSGSGVAPALASGEIQLGELKCYPCRPVMAVPSNL